MGLESGISSTAHYKGEHIKKRDLELNGFRRGLLELDVKHFFAKIFNINHEKVVIKKNNDFPKKMRVEIISDPYREEVETEENADSLDEMRVKIKSYN